MSFENKNSHGTLTEAERRVLELVSQAQTNKETAKVLGVTATIKRHLENIRLKLHLKNRVEAAIYGLSRCLSRSRLHWVAVLAPTAFFALLAGIIVLYHPHTIQRWVVILLMVVVSACASFLFSRFVFINIRRQEAEILQYNRELAALNTMGEILIRSIRVDDVLPRALDTILEVTGVEAGEIFIQDEETGEMVLRAHRGLFHEAFEQVARFKPGEGFPGRVVATGEPIIVHELDRDPRLLRNEVVARGFRAFASVPLKARGKVQGVLSVAAFDPRRPSREDLSLLTGIGHQLGIAIENFRLSERLQVMAVVEERERLARELHDSLAQQVALLLLKIGVAEQALGRHDAPEAARALGDMRQIAGGAYDDLSQSIFGLRAAASRGGGFVPTLSEYLQNFGRLRDVRVDVVVEDADIRLSPHMEVQVHRIIHEALTNVFKHARATKSVVRLERAEDHVRITIEDNGCGFVVGRVTRNGFQYGLQTMRERAEKAGGSLAIETALGAGTKVIASFPLRGGGRPWM